MTLPDLAPNGSWWIAQAELAPLAPARGRVPAGCVGCLGWLAVYAPDEDCAEDCLRTAVRVDGFHARSVRDVQLVVSLEEIDDVDEHLADNVRNLAPGRRAAWGTLECYTTEGEA